MKETNEMNEPPVSAEQFWEDFYQDRDVIWSGKPNSLFLREAAELKPGTALDLGCGEGADAIWLAQQGWRVTAADISETALRRAAIRAAEAGIANAIDWVRHDLASSFPDGLFDLVAAQFLHSPVALPGEREAILRRAAEAVAPDGTLLIISHAGWPSWVETPPFEHRFPAVPEIISSVELTSDRWRVEVAEVVETEMTSPEGQPGHRIDSVIRAVRHQTG